MAWQPSVHPYDNVGLPPVRAIVSRINRRRGTCPRCQNHVAAPAPESFEPGSPFSPNIRARHPPAHHPDHTPPGDWTLAVRRGQNGGAAGIEVGCWLARRLPFTAARRR